MKDFMRVFAIFSIDIADLFAGIDACAFSVPFFTNFSYHMLLLPALTMMVMMAALCAKCIFSKKLATGKIITKASSLVNAIIFLLYPGICTKVFAALKCKQIGARSYLTTDFSVECWVGEHGKHVAIVFLALAIYVLGIPLLTLMVLRYNRAHLFNKDSPKHEALENSIGSLYLTYEPTYYYWEVVEMFRKMMLTGAIQIVGTGSSAQMLFAVLICLEHLSVVLRTCTI